MQDDVKMCFNEGVRIYFVHRLHCLAIDKRCMKIIQNICIKCFFFFAKRVGICLTVKLMRFVIYQICQINWMFFIFAGAMFLLSVLK